MKQSNNKPQSVVLYDRDGNPVQVSTEHIEAPVISPHQKLNKKDYLDLAQHAFEKQIHTTSHVTNSTKDNKGHNFDPKMRSQYANEPNVVHATRPVEPVPFPVSDEVQRLHEESVKRYPDVNLSQGEFVIHDVTRHLIGLLAPVGATTAIALFILALLFSIPFVVEDISSLPISYGVIMLIGSGLIVLMAVLSYIAVWVYLKNRLILTNESIIQEIQYSLFSKHEQTVSLGSVEDASYKQFGVIPTIFNYGLVRLSTEGEETTYRFDYVNNPKEQTAILINAVEAFKNGRPVTADLFDKIKKSNR